MDNMLWSTSAHSLQKFVPKKNNMKMLSVTRLRLHGLIGLNSQLKFTCIRDPSGMRSGTKSDRICRGRGSQEAGASEPASERQEEKEQG